MTAQQAETLILDDRVELLHSLPLDPYWDARGVNMRLLNKGGCSALHRGYVGVWEVFDDNLFLIGLVDYKDDAMDATALLGGRQFPIKAEWFSGRLEIDRGERLTYFHMGWGSQYAERLRLYVEQGRVVARRRYDQRKVLRRHYNANFEQYEEFRRDMAERGSSALGPLGGLTEAGLKALGRSPFADESLWDDDSDDVDWKAEMWCRQLLHCTRPGPVPGNVAN